MKKLVQVSAVALLALTMTGCLAVREKQEGIERAVITGHPGGAYLPRNTTRYDLENRENFVLMDKPTQVSVTSPGIQVRKLNDDRLEVVAHLRNRKARQVQVQVSCIFKDAQGFSTGDETPWTTVILTENAQEDVRFTSMNNKAERYTIRVRQVR